MNDLDNENNNGNLVDDPFDEIVTDEDLRGAHILLQRRQLYEDIYKYICRGHYNVKWLVERFSNDIFPPEEIKRLIAAAKERMVAEFGDFNPQIEVLSYLAVNTELKQTLFDLLDKYKDGAKPRTILELIKAISDLDKERLDFAKFVGLAVKLKETGEEKLDHSLPAADMHFAVMLEVADDVERKLSGGYNNGNKELPGETGLQGTVERKVAFK